MNTQVTKDTTVAEIAGRLTKAQREALLGRRSLHWGGGKWPLRHALSAKGLVSGFACEWTQLGLAVRAHLANKDAVL